MIVEAIYLLTYLLLIGVIVGATGTSYIMLSCENTSYSICGNTTAIKQQWEDTRHMYMSPFAGWLEWVNSMIGW